MKAFLLTVLVFGLAAAALFAPVGGRSFWARAQEHGIPTAIARSTAHGLRASWDFLASLGEKRDPPQRREVPHAPPRHPSRKAQASSAPPHRASRDGIVVQPVKERIEETDRAALEALVVRSR